MKQIAREKSTQMLNYMECFAAASSDEQCLLGFYYKHAATILQNL